MKSAMFFTLTACIGLMWVSLSDTADGSDLIEVFTEPYRTIELAAAEQGIVDSLAVQHGEQVRAGDTVATLNQEVLIASLKIARMKAAMNAPIQKAAAQLRQKQRRYEKILSLHQNGHASEEELDTAKTALEIARAEMTDAEERQQLAMLQVEEITAQLRRRTITSPVDGEIVKIHKETGEYVASLEPVVATVVQLNKLRVKFYLDTASARQLQAGHRVPVLFVESGQHVTGSIEFVSPTTDADSSTVRVEVVIDNAEGHLRSGVLVRMLDHQQARTPRQRISR